MYCYFTRLSVFVHMLFGLSTTKATVMVMLVSLIVHTATNNSTVYSSRWLSADEVFRGIL